ncbi:MAG: WxcM-like domain-containing protein [Marinosulfonomonas sp.]|nr:WxcM-like domain-containing protein [Marinosulfonomonas sp.]
MKPKPISSDVVVPQGVAIDHSVTIAAGVLLSDRLAIEADAVIERGVVFANGGAKPIQVRSCVLIGAGAVIGPEVELGWGVHVKPGSVVLASVPANAVVQGNPARIVGYVNSTETAHLAAGNAVAPISPSGDRREVSIEPLGIGSASVYYMPRISDLRGSLSVGEFEDHFPFAPKRYFVVFDVPSEELRGEHAHKTCQQFLICVQGSCRALLDDGSARREVVLDRPDIGLYMPSMIWGTQYRYTRDAVLLVFTSHAYDASDYIRTYDDFRKEVAGRPNDTLS